MGAKLDKLTIRGFKSIRKLENFELRDLNVLIGANGAGKSNFVGFFWLLREMVNQRLQSYAARHAPTDGLFYGGIKETKKIEAELFFAENKYSFELLPTPTGTLMVEMERAIYLPMPSSRVLAHGSLEAKLMTVKDESGRLGRRGPNWYVWDSVSSWQVYHFHDTSVTAGMRRPGGVEQKVTLMHDGANLAAFLLGLRESLPQVYQKIVSMLQRIAPYFDDFVLTVTKGESEDQVRLTWKQKGSEYIFSPGHLSDGTIRFLCLVTALLQPNPPSTIVLDEPELGLHPEALILLAGLQRSVSKRMQIIVATQSPQLLNEFEPEDVITVDHVGGASQFRRLDTGALSEWLSEYTLGEIWQKGTIAGGVNHG